MKTYLLILTISILFFSNVLAQEDDESLILYLAFDKGKGDVAKDYSEYGNDGTLNGKPKWVEGKFGKALEFNGEDQWVQVPDNETLRVTDGVTVMAWINTERYTFPGTKWQGILAKSNSPRSYSFYTEVNKGLHFSTSAGVPKPFYGSVSTSKISLNEWQHVVAIAEPTKDGGLHKFYINGEPAGQRSFNALKTLPGDTDTDDVLVGRTWEGSRFFLGIIDEVRIWNRVLSQEEVKHHMSVGKEDLWAVQPLSELTTTWGKIKSEY